MVKLEIENRSA